MAVNVIYDLNNSGQYNLQYSIEGLNNKVWFGSGSPDNNTGENGDSYIDTQNNVYHVKTNGAWGSANNLVPQGQTPQGALLAGTATPTTQGMDGEIYLKVDFVNQIMHLYEKANGAWGSPKAQFFMKSMQAGSEVHQMWVGDVNDLPTDRSDTTYYEAYETSNI